MIQIEQKLTPDDLKDALSQLWEVAGPKIVDIEQSEADIGGTPVITADGRYVAQGWTEWTQGFQFGCALLQFEATDDAQFLDIGRRNTLRKMASHVTHVGVHDHGFNQISTYGNLRRLMLAGRIPHRDDALAFYELALKASSAVQAHRWTETSDQDGFIYSFNGPHSLFCDTIRSLRSLAIGYLLGHTLWSENDRQVSLLDRLIQHARSTAKYSVYYGQQRDHYDQRGRVAHESVFNLNDGNYRCPSTQQGYSPFSTWTRGLSWIMLGYPEQLEMLAEVDPNELDEFGGYEQVETMMRNAATAVCDFYIENTPTCGVPYWDTGAPGLTRLGDYLARPAEPVNDHEPVDSSAAAIAAQGLLRLGDYLQQQGDVQAGRRYWQAGLTVAQTVLNPPYLTIDPRHQGLLQHVVYHRPRGWDHVPAGSQLPYGESAMWGDYHLLELGLYLQRRVDQRSAYRFFEAGVDG